MLQDQVLPVDFGQGVDTKTDPKLVVPGKLLMLQNGVFTNPKRVGKRNGYSGVSNTIVGGGTLTNPKLIKNFMGELFAADGLNLYGYSPSLSAWINKGSHTSVELKRSCLDKTHNVNGQVDCAVLGNYALYAWSDNLAQSFAAVVDISSGAVIFAPTKISAGSQSTSIIGYSPRCVVLGGTALAVVWATSGLGFVIRTLSVSTSGVSFSAQASVTSAAANTSIGGWLLSYPCDVAPTSTGAVLLSYDGTNLVVTTLSSAGAAVSTYSIAMTQTICGQSVCVDSSTGNLWIYWAENNSGRTNATLKYMILSSSLSVVLAATTIVAAGTTNEVYQISVLPLSSTQQQIYFNNPQQVNSSPYVDITKTCVVQSSGSVGSISNFAPGVIPFSRPIAVSGRNYMVFVYRTPITAGQQYSMFLLDLTTGAVVARWANGTAATVANSMVTNYVPSAALLSPTQITFGCGIDYQFIGLSNVIAAVNNFVGAAAITISFSSARTYRATFSGQLAILNGACPQMYDGQSSSEFGFHLAPDIISISTIASSGAPAATYSYIAVFQWTDAQGNFHQSAPSAPSTVSVTAGFAPSSVYITSCFLSQKKNVSISLYRTTNGGSTYYLANFDAIHLTAANPVTSAVNSTLSAGPDDATLIGNQQLYTNGGVLPNSPPPASVIIESHNNRLWMVDPETPGAAWYSKTFTPGVGLAMSADLTHQIDQKLGDIGGLGAMDDKMVVFKDQGFCAFSGDGANDTGTGSTLSTPQFVPSDVGISQLKSICLMPQGILFKSTKGWCLLDRALNVHYDDQLFNGAAVEAFNSQDVTSAVIHPTRSQVITLTSSGSALIYDYIMGQWSTFTNHQGYSGDAWGSLYVYARTDGSIFQENPSSYLDGSTSFRLRAQTSWLNLAGVQGFQRVRRTGLLGDFANGSSGSHGVQISAAYDFQPTFGAPVPFLPGAASASGVLSYRERLAQQKCTSISLLIEEIVTGASGESIDFSNLSFEAGVKRGMKKLPAAQSVG